MNPCTDKTTGMDDLLDRYLSPKQKQWAWFCILWSAGLGSAMLLGLMVRLAMGIHS
jgi:hypothetical protein